MICTTTNQSHGTLTSPCTVHRVLSGFRIFCGKVWDAHCISNDVRILCCKRILCYWSWIRCQWSGEQIKIKLVSWGIRSLACCFKSAKCYSTGQRKSASFNQYLSQILIEWGRFFSTAVPFGRLRYCHKRGTVYSVHQEPSYESNVTLLAPVWTQLVYLSISRINNMLKINRSTVAKLMPAKLE